VAFWRTEAEKRTILYLKRLYGNKWLTTSITPAGDFVDNIELVTDYRPRAMTAGTHLCHVDGNVLRHGLVGTDGRGIRELTSGGYVVVPKERWKRTFYHVVTPPAREGHLSARTPDEWATLIEQDENRLRPSTAWDTASFAIFCRTGYYVRPHDVRSLILRMIRPPRIELLDE
jgi:hypothetical protein